MRAQINQTLVDNVKAVFKFELDGQEPGTWVVDLKNGSG